MDLYKKQYYSPRIMVEILKKIITEQVSTTVVIRGDAIIAGSSHSFFASIGSTQPKDFERVIVSCRVRPTAIARKKTLQSVLL